MEASSLASRNIRAELAHQPATGELPLSKPSLFGQPEVDDELELAPKQPSETKMTEDEVRDGGI